MTGNDVHEKLRKIQALVERGVGGEKEAARMKLLELAVRYGVELQDEEFKEHRFDYGTGIYVKNLMQQVIFSVVLKAQFYKSNNPKHTLVIVDCTALQALEIDYRFSIYNASLQEQAELFYEAFVRKNQIFNPEGEGVDVSSLSAEELARQRKVRAFETGAGTAWIHKALGS